MKTIEIIGYERANLGKKASKDLRQESMVPCVLYGGPKQIHFYTPAFLFRDIIYSPEACKVNLFYEGQNFTCILQEAQFHPVNEMILHVDLLELVEGKQVKMDIPLAFVGTSPGVLKGGKFNQKLKRLKVMALPKDLPDQIMVDISNLEVGKTVKVGEIKAEGYTIINSKSIPVCSVDITRSMKQESASEEKDAKKKK